MTLYFARDVETITTPVHTHKRKKGEEQLIVDCNDESCVAAMERYGAVSNVRETPLTTDERNAEEEAKELQQGVIGQVVRDTIEGRMTARSAG